MPYLLQEFFVLYRIWKDSIIFFKNHARIWNEVVEDGIAFPQEELLDMESGAEFFASQSYTGVAAVKMSGSVASKLRKINWLIF